MKLRDLGERKIIENLSGLLKIGDDAAYMSNGKEYLVLSTDIINQKTHIPKDMTPEQVGKFIASINLSDIAAMGAKPKAFMLSCGLPEDMEFSDFESIVKAAKAQCNKFGTEYVGGDTKQNDSLTLAGFCLGITKKPVLRSGAKKGDIIAVTGTVGDAALGFDLLLKKINHPLKKKLVKKALEPEPKVAEGLLLSRYATAMTDLSDGLSVGLHNIAEMSQKGMKIYSEKIPTSKEAEKITEFLGLELEEYALAGGGDYQLLFAIKKRDLEKIGGRINASAIGVVTEGRKILLSSGEKTSVLEKKGYEHFS
jgi:thiamine-monophosphate kinase